MHIHIWQLVAIVILTALALWANKNLTPAPLQRWIMVLIVVVAVLFTLVSLGLLGGTGISVSA